MKALLQRLSVAKRSILIVSTLALLLGLLSFALPSGQVHAASWGCENNPVNINGTTYYACVTMAQPCLHVRNVFSFAVTGCLPYHTTIYVYGQYTWGAHVAAGSDIWDGIKEGGVVSDAYVNTSNFNTLSPPIRFCEIIGGPGWIGEHCS